MRLDGLVDRDYIAAMIHKTSVLFVFLAWSHIGCTTVPQLPPQTFSLVGPDGKRQDFTYNRSSGALELLGAGAQAFESLPVPPERNFSSGSASTGDAVRLAEVAISSRCGEGGVLYYYHNRTSTPQTLVVMLHNESKRCPIHVSLQWRKADGELEKPPVPITQALPGDSGGASIEIFAGREAVLIWACPAEEGSEDFCRGRIQIVLR